MSPEERAILAGTISHFREIARLNRFAENGIFPHDTERCAVCTPSTLSMDPFVVYLDVAAQSILVRRPRLDQALVDEINADLALMGETLHVSLETLLAGEPESIRWWKGWIGDALATALGLLSIHSPASLEFDLEEQASRGFADLIEETARKIMAQQRGESGLSDGSTEAKSDRPGCARHGA